MTTSPNASLDSRSPGGEPWAEWTYNGFSHSARQRWPAGREFRILSPNRPRRWDPRLVIATLAAAAIGALAGLWAKPELAAKRAETAQAAQPAMVRPLALPAVSRIGAPAAKPTDAQPPRPTVRRLDPPQSRKGRTIEVSHATGAAPVLPARQPQPREQREGTLNEQLAATNARSVPRMADPARSNRGAAESSRPACDGASTRTERIVCASPALRRDDRRMERAIQRALDAGVSPRDLFAEQNDWLAVRDDAAGRSVRAIESAYEQRIRELNRLANDELDQDWR